ncbi:class I SAM-dependent methyltransferase [Streptomyces sp. NPDC002004]
MTTTSQEAFLRAFHAERPAVTADALAGGRTADDRSSYEILCDRVAGRRRVLDLGCGDGLLLELLARTPGRELAGLDLSPDSLALARLRPALAGAALVEGRAQHLPFPDDDFDACVSHMALMLMADVEQVVAEIARVLTPGGVLACVLGGGAVGGEAYDLFLGLARPLIDALPAARRIPALGDRRTRTREGLDGLLGPAGFAPADWETITVDLGGTPEQVWTTMSGIYDVGPLDPPALTSLREAFLPAAKGLRTPDGRVPCAMNLHVVTARLR